MIIIAIIEKFFSKIKNGAPHLVFASSCRVKATDLLNIIKDPRCPQSISLAAFAKQVLMFVEFVLLKKLTCAISPVSITYI